MEDKKYTVYMHVNKSNGKKYVGITCQKPEKRWGRNGSGYNRCPAFHNAICKYGWDNFIHIIVNEGLIETEAKAKEISLIKEFRTKCVRGYNLTDGGDGASGSSHSPETKLKMMASSTHHWAGKTFSTEHRINISKSMKGRRIGPDNPFFGKHHTEEAKKKNSIAHEGNNNVRYGTYHSEEAKQKISAAKMGSIVTDETRAKISAANKGKTSHMKGKFGELNQKSKKVLCVTTGNVYGSAREAGRKTDTDHTSIVRCCKGERKTASGLGWTYYDDYINQQAAI